MSSRRDDYGTDWLHAFDSSLSFCGDDVGRSCNGIGYLDYLLVYLPRRSSEEREWAMDRAKIVIGSDHRIQGVYRNQLIRFFVRRDICWIARLAGLSRYGKDFRWARGRYQCPLIDDDEDSRSNKATFEQQIALLFRLCDEELFI